MAAAEARRSGGRAGVLHLRLSVCSLMKNLNILGKLLKNNLVGEKAVENRSKFNDTNEEGSV